MRHSAVWLAMRDFSMQIFPDWSYSNPEPIHPDADSCFEPPPDGDAPESLPPPDRAVKKNPDNGTDSDFYKQNIVPVRTQLAKMYVEKQSCALDIYCIFRTVQLIVQIVLLKKKDFALTKYEEEAQEQATYTCEKNEKVEA